MKHTVNVTATEVNVKPLKDGQVDLTFDMDDFDLDNILDEFDPDDILRNIDETDIVSYLESVGYTVRD
jgi:hypothetical protein